jgi:hypothetical protein
MKSWNIAIVVLLLMNAGATSLLADTDVKGDPVYFVTDVVPQLTKFGCNSGGCHGKATGQNGFKLSLLGFEPEDDYEALIHEGRGRRIFAGSPDQSLILLKAIAAIPHGGGKRIEIGSDAYQTLYRWIERGAPPPSPRDPVLEKISVSPEHLTFDAATRQQQLKVTALFSDGTSRDVSRQAIYTSNEPEVADVNDAGFIAVNKHSGLFAVMVRYGDQISAFYGTVPFRNRSESVDRVLDAWDRANPDAQ